METPRKYVALRWIGIVASVASWVVLALTVIALLWVLANVGANWARTLLVVLVLFWGVSTFLSFFVRGTVMLLLTEMEDRERANQQVLSQMRSMLDAARTTVARPASASVDRATTQMDTGTTEAKKPNTDLA